MMRRLAWMGCGAWIAAVGCGVEEGEQPDGETPGWSVELFAPGVVSTPAAEFATAFSPSGDTVYFNRVASTDFSRIDLLYSIRLPSGWGEPQPYPALAGVRAIDPFVSLDGRTLYVSADLPRAGAADGSYAIWRFPLLGGDGAALPEPINTDSSEVYSSLDRTGRMVFSSRRDGERRVYETRRTEGEWSAPRLLSLGPEGRASNPAIHPDGRLLVYAAQGEGGDSDLFVTCGGDEGWAGGGRLPEPVNSAFGELAPAFHGGYLYFTSERPGLVASTPEGVRPPGDIYRVPENVAAELCG